MRFVAVLLVAFACSGALASDPGQPIDCSDWVFSQPGLSCSVALSDCGSSWGWCTGNEIALDNQGWMYQVQRVDLGVNCSGSNAPLRRTQVLRLKNGVVETLAHIDDRCHANGNVDAIEPIGSNSINNAAHRIDFDDKSGRLLIPMASHCAEFFSPCPWSGTRNWMASIEGMATTFDVLQTYTPQSSLGFRVPYMPEGMAGADHFDTYWGSLAHPLDFTQAHPLQCDHPAAAPHVGDYLTVADTVPTPAPGQGVYYVTAASYQGATRYGRKTTGGVLSGRDPALLPACMQP